MRFPGAMLVLAVPFATCAATFQVPGDYSTIQDAIAEAGPGDRIEVGPGSWTGPIAIDGDLEIVGTAGSSTTRIEMTGGTGPAVLVSGATVLLEGFRIANTQGRALEVDGAVVDLVGLWIAGQTTDDSGAAIHLSNGSDVWIDASTFQENTSGGSGGHILAEDSSLAIHDSHFAWGTAAESGGAIALFDSAATIEGSWFTDNGAALGGAIAFDLGDTQSVEVTASAFFRNQATSGGALWGLGADATLLLAYSVLDANTAQSGGGVYAKTLGGITASGNLFCANTATAHHGGAVYAEDIMIPGVHAWTNNLFVENGATEDGGAVYVKGQSACLRNNHLLGNEAGGNGGALHLSGVAYTLVNNLVAYTGSGDGAYATSVNPPRYNDWFDNTEVHVSGDLDESLLGPSNLFDDPLLVSYSPDGNCGNDVLRPAGGSPLIDAGSPSFKDPDGTDSDIGAFGGPGTFPGPLDADGDGVPFAYDCDDQDAGVSPLAQEVCDPADVDEDCDGYADDADPEGAEGPSPWYGDADSDGFGDASDPRGSACDGGDGTAPNALDCNDGDAAIHPGADEVCDPVPVDEDCDGFADDDDPEGALGESAWYPDGDEDGYGDALDLGTTACSPPPKTVDNALDCDDGDEAVNPDASEVCDAEDEDEDCDGLADDADPSATGQVYWYLDGDEDGYGDDTVAPVSACDGGAAVVRFAGDCDDRDAAIHPGAAEVCDPDGIDEDCDGVAEDADPDVTGQTALCPDADGDGYGDASTGPSAHCPSEGWVADCTDCDDALEGVNPSGTEIWYDGLDQDCDGNDDDRDLDGHIGEAAGGPDCNDLDPTVHPGAEDLPGDGVDQDCDGNDARILFGNGLPYACGCGSGAAPAGWLWVPLVIVAMRRRAACGPDARPAGGRRL